MANNRSSGPYLAHQASKSMSKLKISSPFNFEHKSKLSSPDLSTSSHATFASSPTQSVTSFGSPSISAPSEQMILVAKRSYMVEDTEIKEGDLLFLKSELLPNQQSVLVQPIMKVSPPFWIALDDVSKFDYNANSPASSPSTSSLPSFPHNDNNYKLTSQQRVSHQSSFDSINKAVTTPYGSISSKTNKSPSNTPSSLISKTSYVSSTTSPSISEKPIIPHTHSNTHSSQISRSHSRSPSQGQQIHRKSDPLNRISLKSHIAPLLTKKQLQNYSLEISSCSLHNSRRWYRIDLYSKSLNNRSAARICLSRYYQDFYDLQISILNETNASANLASVKSPRLPQPFQFDSSKSKSNPSSPNLDCNNEYVLSERCRDLEVYLKQLIRFMETDDSYINPIVKWFNPRETDLVLNDTNFHMSSEMINESLNQLKDSYTSKKLLAQNSSTSPTCLSQMSHAVPKERLDKYEKQLKKHQDIFVPRPYPSFLKNYENILPLSNNAQNELTASQSAANTSNSFTPSSSTNPTSASTSANSNAQTSANATYDKHDSSYSTLSSNSCSYSSSRLSNNTTHSYSNSNTSSFDSEENAATKNIYNNSKDLHYDAPTKPLFYKKKSTVSISSSTPPSNTSANRTAALLPSLNTTNLSAHSSNQNSPRHTSLDQVVVNGVNSPFKSQSLPNSPVSFQSTHSLPNGGEFKSRQMSSSSLSSNKINAGDNVDLIKFKIMHDDEIITFRIPIYNVSLPYLKAKIGNEFGKAKHEVKDEELRFKNFKNGLFIDIKTDFELSAFINDQFYVYNKILIKLINTEIIH